MRPRPVGRRACGRCNAILSAVALTCTATTLPAYSADPDAATDQLHTATPIKHVVVVIGENRSFDHVYGTYVPKSGDSILNLLSEVSSARMARLDGISAQQSSSRPRARQAISSASLKRTRPPTRSFPVQPWVARRTRRAPHRHLLSD